MEASPLLTVIDQNLIYVRVKQACLYFVLCVVISVTWTVSLQEMCSLQCSLHKVNKEEQTRVVLDSRVTQQSSLAPLK